MDFELQESGVGQLIMDLEVQGRSEGFPSRAYLVPGRDAPRARPNGESSWETVAAAAVAVAAVTWKFRLTFRPGNYI